MCQTVSQVSLLVLVLILKYIKEEVKISRLSATQLFDQGISYRNGRRRKTSGLLPSRIREIPLGSCETGHSKENNCYFQLMNVKPSTNKTEYGSETTVF